MIVVTGGAGFIGSHWLERLNAMGETDILVVDDLTDGTKIHNLAGREIRDYLDLEDFIVTFEQADTFPEVTAVVHQGACSATTEWNGRYLMKNNYEYSKRLVAACQRRHVPFLYASSASVYGLGQHGFREAVACEWPINAYAYSKWQFDQYVRQMLERRTAPVVGLRYFNVYGTREAHKGSMASTLFHFSNQVVTTGVAKLFGPSHGYAAGEQLRDFVDVRDCVDVGLWFLGAGDRSGIYNVGTGEARSFNDMARAVIAALGRGVIEYVDFPEKLRPAYQAYTQADLTGLRAAGYSAAFRTLESGVADYIAATYPTGTPA